MKLVCLVCVMFLPMVCHAMADRTPPIYGRPTLYGEYEISPNDTAAVSGMYGPRDMARPAPIRAGVKNAVAKHPVKTKKVARVAGAKKSVAKKKPAPSVIVENKEPDDVIVVPEKVVEKVKPKTNATPVVSEFAMTIAGALSIRDVDSFCVTTGGAAGRGDGDIILMPGRPDLMSCRGKK